MRQQSADANGDVDMCRQRELGTVAVVMANYNGRKYLKGCIESIRQQTYKNLFITIVDNCSADHSANFLLDEYPEIDLITCDENKGFATGNNIGIRYAVRQGAEYVLLLNTDTVIEPLLIEKLVHAADGGTAVAVPKIYSDKRRMKIWYAGGGMDTVNGKSYHYGWSEKTGIRDVDFACGCCVLIPRDILEKAGMFDEKYYLYFEDTDLSFRWRKKGIPIRYVPEARMWHRIGGSGGKDGNLKHYYMIRNHLYFIKKYQDEIQKKVYRVALDVFIERVLKEHNQEKRRYAWWGILDFYMGRMSEFSHG